MFIAEVMQKQIDYTNKKTHKLLTNKQQLS